ncbi:MAG: ribulose-phosphate 3-epimerase [Anaerolineae bacterium]|nr:ribulose-phosphate 3-epimerase [Anaerolineae bacterium]MDQ7034836.1 ribulose-phosphate 3-epimerase [Anaerolineae bacterium]
MGSYSKVKIAPSLLAADFMQLGQQIKDAEAAGADLLHYDVMDGRFVPNITMGMFILKQVRQITTLPLDVHLMIVEPERYIKQFADAGANSISVHIEACPNLHRTLQLIRESACKVGVAINPHTPADHLSEIITMLDMINVMTVNPGFGGQQFLQTMTSKIATLRAMIGDVQGEVDIEVDGGINVETANDAVQAGANILIAGTTIFRHPNGVQAGIDALRNSLEQTAE